MGSVTAEVFQAPLTTVTALRVRAVRVPLDHPHRTASGVITESPLVLTDVLTGAGTTGHSMVFTYTNAALKPTADLIKNFEPLVSGEPLAPAHIEQRLAAREPSRDYGSSTRKVSPGSKNRHWLTTTSATRSWRAKRKPRSSVGKTGGEPWTCSTPSKHMRRTS